MEKRSKSLNIAICPPAAISQKAISISKKLKNKGGLFVLNRTNRFPHITLYMTEFPLRNVARVKNLLRQTASKTKPFLIKAVKYRQHKNGYIDISFRKSNRVKRLQERIIKLLNPLRKGLIREKDKAEIQKLGKIQQKNIKLYGYRGAGAEFRPHLTFTKLAKLDKPVFAGVKTQDFSFIVTQLGLFYLGDYGTCRKTVSKFDFS